jgi:hypothetical protein
VISAAAALALLVAALLPLHSTSWSHDRSLAHTAGLAWAAQAGAHDTHDHPRFGGGPCEACLALTQARTAPVKDAGPRLETPFENSSRIAFAAPLLLPAAPAQAQNHSRAPPACA